MAQKKFDLAATIRQDGNLSLGAKLRLILTLSWPAVMAQLSTILMEYIDAAMVGSQGAGAAASIGLVSTTTWLFWGLGTSTVTGYAVQLAHHVGANRLDDARAVLRQSIVVTLALALILAVVAIAISPALPRWLGGGEAIRSDATAYFAIFGASMPMLFMSYLASSMLRCSGNMFVPGVTNVMMCVLDVLFNMIFIYEGPNVAFAGIHFTLPFSGLGLGVCGAALGTLAAEVCAGSFLLWYMFRRNDKLRGRLVEKGRSVLHVTRSTFRRACQISWPMALERCIMCGAQILITAIVAPLGTAAIAANSFGITAESLCYMPGYGLSDASTTLVGQSLGASKRDLARSFGRITIVTGMVIMGLLGVIMWLAAPAMMAMFTTDGEVIGLGVTALRTEAWAEAMFGAAIVTYGVFVGAGYTKVPAIMNFTSIWAVRLTLSAILAPSFGLFGVWLAMAIELTVRGAAFLFVFVRGHWLNKAIKIAPQVAEGEVADPTPFEL